MTISFPCKDRILKVLHFDSLDSTQAYLKLNIKEMREEDEQIIVTADGQKQGIGRNGNLWHSYDNALAFSFTISPKENVALTSLELATNLIAYFEQTFQVDLAVKWPNDIFTNDLKKCCGIICNFHSKKTIIAGVGVNLGKGSNSIIGGEAINPGDIACNQNFSSSDRRELSVDIYKYLIENRKTNKQVRESWQKKCFHMNKNVTITNGKSSVCGAFIGIGESGEALISKDGQTHKFVSGSLSICL